MKVSGKFVAILHTREEDKYHPEGKWSLSEALFSDSDYIVGPEVAANVVPQTTFDSQHLWLSFRSASGGTGGDLKGYLVAPNVFKGEGEVWGAGHSNWQSGSLFAPSIHPVKLYAISPQVYTGSLPGMAGKSIQEAKTAYDALPVPSAVDTLSPVE